MFTNMVKKDEKVLIDIHVYITTSSFRLSLSKTSNNEQEITVNTVKSLCFYILFAGGCFYNLALLYFQIKFTNLHLHLLDTFSHIG